ncbi:MAG: hypothetical protein Q9162_006360 [Coniocarpon cinnabarinum]
MAGNPFRRKQEPDQLPQLRSEEATKAFDDALQSLSTGDAARRPSAVKKQVRIKTPPPLSPDSPDSLIRKVSNEGHAGSPPPQSPIEVPNRSSDPFSQQFANEIIESQSEEALDNARRNSATVNTPPPAVASAVVLNPFQSTLASMEPGKAKDEVQKKKESQAPDATISSSNHTLDVDSFTKMLMTGAEPPVPVNKGQSHETDRAAHANGEMRERNEGERPMSTARPSDPPANSSSYDDLSSASSGDGEGKPKARPVAAPAKVPPPVPRHRHGKSVQEQGPQTVSFADFGKASAPSDTPASRQTSSDTSPRSIRQASASSETQKNQRQTTNSPAEGTQRSRPPPPIPGTRRSNSIKSQKSESAETARINNTQPGLSEADPPPSPGLTKSQRAPPPPPSRRTTDNRPHTAADASSTVEVASLNSDNASLAGESYLSTDSSSIRQAANLTTSGSRTSSGSIPTSAQMPPPPPPRRRRGSSKSSAEIPLSENRRTSHESGRSAAGLAQLSEFRNESQSTSKPPEDIMADLSAFQAEVEALRAQSLRRAS